MAPSFSKSITVPEAVIDENGHVNNVAYVQWMQDVAVEHYTALGGMEAQKDFGTWFVRRHQIEYLLPALARDEIEIHTWVDSLHRVRSLRKYEFRRKDDGKMLVRGETEWVFVAASTGRPMAIPPEVCAVFQPGRREAQE